MTKLRMACLVAGLAGACASGAAAQVKPTANGSYPVGTVVQGVCKKGAKGLEIGTIIQGWFRGGYANGPWLPPQGTDICTYRMTRPGRFRLRIYSAYGDKTIQYVPFTIGGVEAPPPNPCESEGTKVVGVSAPNGGTSGLEGLRGQSLRENQQLTANANTYLDFADGSRVAIAKGTTFRLDGCSQPTAPELPPGMRFTLMLGQVWAKIAPESGRRIQVSTERTVAGNRGTTFWMSYDRARKLTAVHVDEGSVWLRAAGRTITVNAGQTATQRAAAQPVVKSAPISTSPPF